MSREPLDDYRSEWKAELKQKMEGSMKFDLYLYLVQQKTFSVGAFGPGLRTKGIIDHIKKELIEIEEEPKDLKEWIDVVTLALDGCWRAGHSPEDIINQLQATLERNMKRTWPDWRTADPDKAIEHDRSKDGNGRCEIDGVVYDAIPVHEGKPAFLGDGAPNPEFDWNGWRASGNKYNNTNWDKTLR